MVLLLHETDLQTPRVGEVQPNGRIQISFGKGGPRLSFQHAEEVIRLIATLQVAAARLQTAEHICDTDDERPQTPAEMRGQADVLASRARRAYDDGNSVLGEKRALAAADLYTAADAAEKRITMKELANDA